MNDLKHLGWDNFFEKQLTQEELQGLTVARIVESLRGLSKAIYQGGEIWAEHTEKSASGAKTREAVPSIGDWVVGTLRDSSAKEKRMRISRVLTRRNKISRVAPGGKGYEQILCANVDTAFLVVALTQHLNLAGVSRYIEILRSNVQPVILVTKVDADTSPGDVIRSLSEVAKGVSLHAISVKEQLGLDALKPYFSNDKTTVLLGASGAGKSTLVNYLLGTQSQRVEDVRESDQKGRHTTTGRRLYSLPTGGMIIDSPGIREIQKWEEPEPAEVIVKKKIKSTKSSRRHRHTDEEDDYES
jgi:ribosome biogenesis GTPase / thiamine phosphate phosphatase